MAWTKDKISDLLNGRISVPEGEDEKSWRTDQLKNVLQTVQQGTADGQASIIELLANAARDQSWRSALGESGLINFVLDVVSADGPLAPDHPLNKQVLRFLGNGCADNEPNRAIIEKTGKLPAFILRCLKEESLMPFACIAALNYCLDYLPAQSQMSAYGLSKALVDIVSGDRLEWCLEGPLPSLSHIMTVLELLSNQDHEPSKAYPDTPSQLLKLATSDRYDADLDSFMEICSPALAYLTSSHFQTHFLSSQNLILIEEAFTQLYTRFDTSDIDEDTAAQLKQIGEAFLTVFADLSALPDFSTACSLDSQPGRTLASWLESSQPPYLQAAACLVLGNLSRSDESSIALLPKVQSSLVGILIRMIPSSQSPTDISKPTGWSPIQLTHAALNFAKNLAIPAANKPSLGAALLDPVHPILPRLWSSTRTQPQLQFAAVSLTRLLLVNCPSNVTLLCTPLEANNNNGPSTLALLVSASTSADADPIKHEVSRAVATVCRALHSPNTNTTSPVLNPSWNWGASDAPSPLAAFYTTHSAHIVNALRHPLMQTRFPALRADVIFTLALMTRSSEEGAKVALRVFLPPSEPREGVEMDEKAKKKQEKEKAEAKTCWLALAEVILGADEAKKLEGLFLFGDTSAQGSEDRGEDSKREEKDGDVSVIQVGMDGLSLSPQQIDMQAQKEQPAHAVRMNRENGLVLLAELFRRFTEELALLRKTIETLLTKGGEFVVKDRQEQS